MVGVTLYASIADMTELIKITPYSYRKNKSDHCFSSPLCRRSMQEMDSARTAKARIGSLAAADQVYHERLRSISLLDGVFTALWRRLRRGRTEGREDVVLRQEYQASPVECSPCYCCSCFYCLICSLSTCDWHHPSLYFVTNNEEHLRLLFSSYRRRQKMPHMRVFYILAIQTQASHRVRV